MGRRLLNRDIIITADTAWIKEQLKQDNSRLSTIGLTAKVNYKKFPIIVHRIKIALIDCSK